MEKIMQMYLPLLWICQAFNNKINQQLLLVKIVLISNYKNQNYKTKTQIAIINSKSLNIK